MQRLSRASIAWRTVLIVAPALLLAGLGCAARGNLMASSSQAAAAVDACGAVEVLQSRAPVSDAQRLAIYYGPVPDRQARFRLIREGIEGAPPSGAELLAHLTVCRRPAPDHAGAIVELKERAAALGANAILDLRYQLILSEHYVGGSRIVGWVYRADAARIPELER